MSPSSPSRVSPPPLKRRRISLSLPQSPHPSSFPSPPANAAPKMSSSRTSSPLRIYSWNINGITSYLPPTTPPITKYFTSPSKSANTATFRPSLRACLHRWSFPHVLFLQEVKIAPQDNKTIALVQRAINTALISEKDDLPTDQLYDAHFNLPRDKYNAIGFGGRVYGVCTLLRRDLGPDVTVKTVEWDLEGRVQVIKLPNHRLMVFNIYAVNGTTNDYRSSTTGKVIGTRHDRKRALHTLLAKEVAAHEVRGWEVVVAGDINISRSNLDSYPQLRQGEDHVQNREDFERKFIKDLGMLDTFRLLHGEEKKYSYRPRYKPWGAGMDRVDLILATSGLRELVRQADILDSEMERGPSDHVPLFIEVDVEAGQGRDEGAENDESRDPEEARQPG